MLGAPGSTGAWAPHASVGDYTGAILNWAPWLTASKLPDLLLFAPYRRPDGSQGDLPTHIRTPEGEEMPAFGEDLATEVGRRYGAPVQMMQWGHGIFDEASLSVIASDTVREIGRLAGRSLDGRRFRPNAVVRLLRSVPCDRRLATYREHYLICRLAPQSPIAATPAMRRGNTLSGCGQTCPRSPVTSPVTRVGYRARHGHTSVP